MAGTLTPAWFLYFTDSTGNPLSGGKVYTYLTGTATPTPVYQDADLSTEWSNPIILPADGKVTIYQDTNIIKAVVFNSADVLQDTFDPIASVGLSASAGGSLFTFGGTPSFPITLTSYPSGADVEDLHPGTGIYSVDSSELVGTYVLQAMMQAESGETTSAILVNLSQGSPDTAIVTINSTATGGELQTSSAITFAAGGTARSYGVKTKVTAPTGFAWNFDLIRTA